MKPERVIFNFMEIKNVTKFFNCDGGDTFDLLGLEWIIDNKTDWAIRYRDEESEEKIVITKKISDQKSELSFLETAKLFIKGIRMVTAVTNPFAKIEYFYYDKPSEAQEAVSQLKTRMYVSDNIVLPWSHEKLKYN